MTNIHLKKNIMRSFVRPINLRNMLQKSSWCKTEIDLYQSMFHEQSAMLNK